MKILIVDNQPLMRKGIIQSLDLEKNHKILEANSLLDALSLCKSNTVDIVFIELHLKDGSGFDFINSIATNKGKNIKIILLASAISIFEFRRAKELNIDGYILKEMDSEDIKYAFNLILKGEKYYPYKLVDKILRINEQDGIRLLTEREMDVLIELAKGLTNSQIGSNLYISEGTAKKHVSNILTKLNMSNRMEVLVYANKLSGSQ